MKKGVVNLCFLALTVIAFISCSSDADDNGQNSVLLGSWQVTSIKVSSEHLVQQPPNGEVLTISFQGNGEFSGNTANNVFGGRYEIKGMTMTMLEFTTTEVADTPFAGVFYEAITAAIVDGTTRAQFDLELSSENQLTFSFGDSGSMTLE